MTSLADIPEYGDATEFIVSAMNGVVENFNLDELESKLGIPHGFYKELLSEASDWGFLVKMAVILEAALAEVIVQKLGNQNIKEHLQRIPVQGRTGKLILAKSLDILNQSNYRRCELILGVRNKFAHGLSHVNSTLEQYASKMSLEESISTLKALMIGHENEFHSPKKKEVKDHHVLTLNFKKIYKMMLWIAGGHVLMQLATLHNTNELDHEIQEFYRMFGEASWLFQTGRQVEGSERRQQALSLRESIVSKADNFIEGRRAK